jgi:hypothetical protein
LDPVSEDKEEDKDCSGLSTALISIYVSSQNVIAYALVTIFVLIHFALAHSGLYGGKLQVRDSLVISRALLA